MIKLSLGAYNTRSSKLYSIEIYFRGRGDLQIAAMSARDDNSEFVIYRATRGRVADVESIFLYIRTRRLTF